MYFNCSAPCCLRGGGTVGGLLASVFVWTDMLLVCVYVLRSRYKSHHGVG